MHQAVGEFPALLSLTIAKLQEPQRKNRSCKKIPLDNQ
jgi:hypothetical protein